MRSEEVEDMRRLTRRTIIALILGSLYGADAFTPRLYGQNKIEESLSQPVKNVHLQANNIGLLLSEIAYKNNIPIGLEVSANDDLTRANRITIDVKEGILRDIFDSIVIQNPLYAWEVRDGVVNFFPREPHRDLVLKEILGTKLEKFSIEKGTTRFSLRESLSHSAPVKRILDQHNVVPGNESFLSREHAVLGRNFSIEESNETIAAVLNQIIRESQTKFWIINRFGDRRQYLLVNL